MIFNSCKHFKSMLLLSSLFFLVIGCDEPGFQIGEVGLGEISIPQEKKIESKILVNKNVIPIDSSLSKLIRTESKVSLDVQKIFKLRKDLGRLSKKTKKISESFNSSQKDFIEYKKEAKNREKKLSDNILLLKKKNKTLFSELKEMKQKQRETLVEKKKKISINTKISINKKNKLETLLVGQPKNQELRPVGKSLIINKRMKSVSENNNLKIEQPEKKISQIELEFQDAVKFYRYRKSVKSSRLLFEKFLTKYPNHVLSDDAQFWIAKTFYLEKNFEQAILGFSKLQVDYPQGNMVPDSIYYEAMSYLNFGDRASAKELLSRLIIRFPSADVSKKAREKLKSF